MQMSRLFEIVYLLLNRQAMTAKELAKHFEVSTRTVYRDVDTLAQAGIPIYASKGSGGGIRLTENFILNKSVLSEDEQKSILTSLHGMNAVQFADVQPVLEKLSALFGSENEDWIEIDFSSWNQNNLTSHRFAALKGAIFTRHVVTFLYSGASGDTQLRLVEPVKLIFRGMDWYLLGWCRMRKDFRFFKLLRMDDLTVIEETFTRRPLIIKNGTSENKYTVLPVQITARVAPEMAYRVRDEFIPKQREQQPDGGFIVRIEMPDNEWLYEYLMTYGASLKILQPLSVKDELVRRLNAALNQYEI